MHARDAWHRVHRACQRKRVVAVPANADVECAQPAAGPAMRRTGRVGVPVRADRALATPMVPASPTMTPATRSECPPRYFVALCMTAVAPRSSGCARSGVAKVLSTRKGTPRSRAAAPIASMSGTPHRGFVMVSAMTSPAPDKARGPASRSSRSMKRISYRPVQSPDAASRRSRRTARGWRRWPRALAPGRGSRRAAPPCRRPSPRLLRRLPIPRRRSSISRLLLEFRP